MKQLQEIKHCMYHDAPRVDIGCLHCPYSLKIGEVWTCWYKPKSNPEQAVAVTLGSDASAARLAERLRGIADEMRNIGASTMTPHELLACYAREVDKVADSLMFAATLGWIDEPDTIRNELADSGLIADVVAPVCVDEKERRAFERGRVHERFAQQIFKEATS